MGSKKVGDTPQVIIRVSVEDKKLIKGLGGKYADIWRLGFEKWIEEIPSELQKKSEYYQKMLLQCNDKLAKCNDIVITKNHGLETLRQEYVNSNRSIDDPTHQDMSWIESRTRNMTGVSAERFLEYCKENS